MISVPDNQPDAKRGYLYYCGGRPAYLQEVTQSALSVRKFHRDADICLFHSYSPDGITLGDVSVFDRVEYIQAENDLPAWFDDPGRHFLTKIQALIQSPYETTLILDSDTRVLAPIGELFDLMDRFDIAVAPGPITQTPKDKSDPILNIPSAFPEPNCGMIVVRRNDRMVHFLERWKNVYRNNENGLFRKHGNGGEQVSLRYMLWSSKDIRPHYVTADGMPNIYNFRYTAGTKFEFANRIKIHHHRDIFRNQRTPAPETVREVSASIGSRDEVEIATTLPQVTELQNVIPIASEEFCDVVRENRDQLRTIESWVTRATWEASLWNYGVPEPCLKEMDQKPGDDVTYSDVLVFLAKRLLTPEYLEIGVSVGKNFFQLIKGLGNAKIVGLDIEGVPPVLKSSFEMTTVKRAATPFGFRNKDNRSVSMNTELVKLSSTSTTNAISIVCGDKFRDETWAFLAGNKFSLIFSDACHIPSSLSTEVEFLIRHQLLAQNHLIMIWDDIFKAQESALIEAVVKLNRFYGGSVSSLYLMNLRGTYGPKRRVALYVSDRRLLKPPGTLD